MNPEHEPELEVAITRELKALPPLSAPPSLAPRIVAALAEQERAPWWRQGWQTWPMVWRALSFSLLLALFAGMCFAGWHFSESPQITAATEKVDGAVAALNLTGQTLDVLKGAFVTVAHHIGIGYIAIAFIVVALAYVFCVGLGSVCLRFAFARRSMDNL